MTESDNILVIIQLVGGNDSLNTLVPLESYDNLVKHRQNILIPQNKLLINKSIGFHPAIRGLHNLFNEGEMCAVNNIGYPLPNRSHFRSMDIWNSGSPSGEQWNTGWLGRLLDLFHAGFPADYPNEKFPDPLAITIGNIASDTCQGTYHNFSHVVDSLDTFIELDKCMVGTMHNKHYADLSGYLNSTITLTNRYTKQLELAAAKGKSRADYPQNNQLAQELKIAAKLISGGLNTKIYVLSLGGFDTHAYQTSKSDSTQGMHSMFLKILSDAIEAFVKDLKLLNLFDKVSIMTYSEFGRQIKSNSAFGTDHGDATSVFLFGNRLKQSLLGNLPQIKAEIEKQSGLEMEIDFRNYYGSLLQEWFDLPAQKIETLFQIPYQHYPIFNKA